MTQGEYERLLMIADAMDDEAIARAKDAVSQVLLLFARMIRSVATPPNKEEGKNG